MDLDGERNVLPIRIGNVASVGQIELRLVVEEGVILCVNCGTGKARSSYEIWLSVFFFFGGEITVIVPTFFYYTLLRRLFDVTVGKVVD